jgi:peptide/nickel transport system substrate-binding protein
MLGVGCTQSGPSSSADLATRHPWTIPGELRVGLAVTPHSLSPLLPQVMSDFMLTRLWSDVLTSYDTSGNQMVPILARVVPSHENGGISPDGKTITFLLRRGVRWQDGAPFSSNDVRFSWTAVMNPNNDVVSRNGYDDVARVDTPDRLTVVFHLKHRYARIVSMLFGDGESPYGILPAHLLARYPELNDVPFNAHPIGTGPFKVVRWLRGDRIELAANDDYFLGRPKLRRIIVRSYGDDNSLVTALRAHEIDWLAEATPLLYRELKTIPDVRTVLTPMNNSYMVWFNTAHPAVADRRVRRAIAYSIDKAALVHDYSYGAAKVADGDIPDFLWAYPRGIAFPTYDPAAAARELRSAGYARAPSGLWERSGVPLAFDLVSNQSSLLDRSMSVALQSMLAKNGITAHLKTYSQALYAASYSEGGIMTAGKFDAMLSRWIEGPDPDDSADLICSARPPGGYNLTRYCNPAMDALQQRALDTDDRLQRAAYYREIETLFANDSPMIVIWWQDLVQAISTDFKGFAPNPFIESWNAYEWSI